MIDISNKPISFYQSKDLWARYLRNLHLINDVENEGLNNYLVLRVNYLSLPKELELMIVLLEF